MSEQPFEVLTVGFEVPVFEQRGRRSGGIVVVMVILLK
jgi:hypothetical protein